MFGASVTGLLTDSCFDIFFIQLRPGKMSSLHHSRPPLKDTSTNNTIKTMAQLMSHVSPFFPGHSRLAELTVLR